MKDFGKIGRWQLLSILLMSLITAGLLQAAVLRPRLMILTDIGGDPDDQQSLIRLMVYANQFRLEGLIATASGTPGELKEAITRPDLIGDIVEAYDKVRPNLLGHEGNWPETEALMGLIRSGNPRRGREAIGRDQDSEASAWIQQQVLAGSPEDPLNIAIWGGQTDLAQALWRIKSQQGDQGLAMFARACRIYDIADQDGLADWINEQFPGLFYILSRAPAGKDKREATFRGMYLGGDISSTSRAWVQANIRNQGPLGALYPLKTWTAPNPHGCLKEGDTPSWFFFLPRGGNQANDPTLPGWGGQFRLDQSGRYVDLAIAVQDPRQSVSRWREDYQRDFARRMAWCLPQ